MIGYHSATSLIGGGAGALDAIAHGDMQENDIAFVQYNGEILVYKAVTLAASEDAPYIIDPDSGGTLQWVLKRPSKPGQLIRPVFSAGPTLIYIGPGGYHLAGKGWVEWDSDLSYTFTGLASSTWRYPYIDYSSITHGVLTASNFTEGGAPTWSDSKMGWYNGDDLCIFAVLGTGASSYKPFKHSGGRLVQYDFVASDLNGGSATSLTAVAITRPSFTYEVPLQFAGYPTTTSGTMIISLDGTNTYYSFAVNTTTGYREYVVMDIILESSNIYYRTNLSGMDCYIDTPGFYLPASM
jgi:hypothetical protein